MAQSLSVIALISGGKDSFFSLLHCIENKHRIVALANLFPPSALSLKCAAPNSLERSHGDSRNFEVVSNDMDSFMYQTVGHSMIPLYSEALGLPLYRQMINGSAVDSSKNYTARINGAQPNLSFTEDDDETESLVPLLKNAMAAHPEANAVCSGAVLSTYQRTRIESVAIRLGLVPLSYLWQYPVLPPPSPEGLLDDMALSCFDIRLVKVASGGLEDDLLWRNLMDADVRRKIQKAITRFGGSVLGEGGEYETLVVDGPSPVWKRRLEVKETSIRRATDSRKGDPASLTFCVGSGQTVAKEQGTCERQNAKLRKIQLWDQEFDNLRRRLPVDSNDSVPKAHYAINNMHLIYRSINAWTAVFCQNSIGSLHYISNLTCNTTEASASEQMAGINRTICDLLATMQRSSKDIVFTTLILRSISEDFVAVNEIYAQLFTEPNPPARVTVSAPLPLGVMVMMSLVIDRGESYLRDGLHVQSRSYWAPANIGPYSQAISVSLESYATLVYVAGQIPLIPAKMDMLAGHEDLERPMNAYSLYQHRICLSLQHLWRIGSQMGVCWWTGTVAFVTASNDAFLKAQVAYRTWSAIHDPSLWTKTDEQDDELDIWDRTYGRLGTLAGGIKDQISLPDFTRLIPCSMKSPMPGFFAVQVNQLPRDSDIEWQSLGVAKSNVQYQDLDLCGATATICSVPSDRTSITYVYIPILCDHGDGDEISRRLLGIISSLQGQILAQSPTDQQASHHSMTVYTPCVDIIAKLEVQAVPCNAIWGPVGGTLRELSAGIVLHSKAQSKVAFENE